MNALRRWNRTELRDRLYAWWWWRSPNRPHILDRTYIDLLDALPEDAVGLDLGSRSRVRPGATTLDVVAADGVDVVGDGHALPFPDEHFDYVWCNAVLEHVRNPFRVAEEIQRVLRPGGLALVQVPFLENVHGWPDDYFRFTPNGLRVLFEDLDEVAAGVSAGPGQVLPDLLQYYATDFAELQRGGLLVNAYTVAIGVLTLPLRYLDRLFRGRPSHWKWARAYYFVGRRPIGWLGHEGTPRLGFLVPASDPAAFEDLMAVRAHEMIETLWGAGAAVAEIDLVSAADAESPLGRRIGRAEPDAIIAPNLNYYLLSALPRHGLLRRLDSRPVLLWDDPLGACALASLQRRGARMGDLGPREGGALAWYRRALGEDALHFAWDSGHVEAVVDLGIAPAESIERYWIATYRAFLEQGRGAPVDQTIDVAFCGNVYESILDDSTFATDEWFAELVGRIRRRKLADLRVSSWEAYVAELEEVPATERVARGLVPDETPFWDLYLHVAWFSLTTSVRLALLESVERPVELFGLFADPGSVKLLEGRPNLRFGGRVEHFGELPTTFARTKVNLCISNGLVFRGVPSKFVDCVASGGFALVDPKPDLVELFGPVVERVFVHGPDELNAKIDHFLAHPDERREIVEELRATIEERCTLDALFARVLARLGAVS